MNARMLMCRRRSALSEGATEIHPHRNERIGRVGVLVAVLGALICGATASHAQQLSGLVVDEGTGKGMGAAAVTVLAPDFSVIAETSTDEVGRFSVSLPAPGAYVLLASRPGHLGASPDRVNVGADGASVIVTLRRSPGAVSVEEATSPGGMASLMGRVVQAGNRRPIAGAEVVLLESGRRLETRWDGRFLMDSVAAGPTTLSVRHLSFAPAERTLGLQAGITYRVDVTLDEQPLEIEGIDVTVAQPPVVKLHRDVLFRMNQDLGGIFLTADDFERRAFGSVAQTLDGLPSIRVRRCNGLSSSCMPPWATEGGDWRWWVQLRGGCVPAIYIDGHVAVRSGKPPGEFLSLSTSQIEILEVYPGPATLPPEYNDPGSLCAIGIWTKR